MRPATARARTSSGRSAGATASASASAAGPTPHVGELGALVAQGVERHVEHVARRAGTEPDGGDRRPGPQRVGMGAGVGTGDHEA